MKHINLIPIITIVFYYLGVFFYYVMCFLNHFVDILNEMIA